jgi:hypothetical protein
MNKINSNRKISLSAGILYILTFVSIPTLSLYIPIHDPDYLLNHVSDTPVIIGAILEIIVALTGIGTAIVLYPVLKKQSESMSIGLVSARILEAATIFIGVMCLLTAVSLHHTSPGSESLITGRTLVTMYDRIFTIGQSFMPAIDDVLLGFMLYKSKLIPRGLALIGIVGGPILLTGTFSVLFGVIGLRDPLAAMTAIPVAVFEFSLGVYLMLKGFKSNSNVLTNK